MNPSFKKLKIVTTITFAVLLCIFILAGSFALKNKRPAFKNYVNNHRHRPVLIKDPSYASAWMTFDYINKVFDLPPYYLQEEMNIQDSKYPFITVKQYSQKTKIPNDVLITETRDAFQRFLNIPKP